MKRRPIRSETKTAAIPQKKEGERVIKEGCKIIYKATVRMEL
jgi:hypothetical protein